ncbi:MAG: hypothetical protein AAB868_00440 [Patescibacteria group bacterium]
MNKNTKLKQKKIKSIIKTVRRIDNIKDTSDVVKNLNYGISNTLRIYDGIMVDTKNFSLISISAGKEVAWNKGNKIK